MSSEINSPIFDFVIPDSCSKLRRYSGGIEIDKKGLSKNKVMMYKVGNNQEPIETEYTSEISAHNRERGILNDY